MSIHGGATVPAVPAVDPAVAWLARAGDAEHAARLMIAFRNWFGRDDPDDDLVREGIRRLIVQGEGEFMLGARSAGGAPEGVCQLRYRWSVWQAGPECALEDLFVVEDARGSGLGAVLVEAALARARERRCRRVELDVSEANGPARRLYERFGFASGRPREGPDLLMRLRL